MRRFLASSCLSSTVDVHAACSMHAPITVSQTLLDRSDLSIVPMYVSACTEYKLFVFTHDCTSSFFVTCVYARKSCEIICSLFVSHLVFKSAHSLHALEREFLMA